MSLNSQTICLSIGNLHFRVWNELRTFGGFRRSVLLRFVGSHCAGNFSLWCSLWQDWLVTGQKASNWKSTFPEDTDRKTRCWLSTSKWRDQSIFWREPLKKVSHKQYCWWKKLILHHLIGYPSHLEFLFASSGGAGFLPSIFQVHVSFQWRFVNFRCFFCPQNHSNRPPVDVRFKQTLVAVYFLDEHTTHVMLRDLFHKPIGGIDTFFPKGPGWFLVGFESSDSLLGFMTESNHHCRGIWNMFKKDCFNYLQPDHIFLMVFALNHHFGWNLLNSHVINPYIYQYNF